MISCQTCGANVNPTAKFCPECGSKDPSKTANSKVDRTDNSITMARTGPTSYGSFRIESLPKGFVIDDRYEIVRKLGQGGYGAVYLAQDHKVDIYKALKVLPEAITNDKEAMLNLQSEAKTMIGLNHPNIVRVYDIHDEGDVKYLDIEYIDGQTLTELKLETADKRLPEAQVKELALQITDGLHYAHNKHIIHKDVKPQNIMLSSDGDIKIMDFGIAETVRVSMSRIDNTSTSGTLVYMSPEQIKGKDVGKESDIYSFGAMLYELLSGHPPFYKGDINYQIVNEEPAEIEGVSDEMNYLINKCLSKDYHDRYGDFEEVQIDLKNDDIAIQLPENTEDIVEDEDEVEIENSIEAEPAYDDELESMTDAIDQEIEAIDNIFDRIDESQIAFESWAKKFRIFDLILAIILFFGHLELYFTHSSFQGNDLAYSNEFIVLILTVYILAPIVTAIPICLNKKSLESASYGKMLFIGLIVCTWVSFLNMFVVEIYTGGAKEYLQDISGLIVISIISGTVGFFVSFFPISTHYNIRFDITP